MKSVAAIIGTLLFATLVACTPEQIPGQPPVQRARLAYLNQTAAVSLTCANGTDCSGKWARALEWVSKHTVYSIKTSTDGEISTNGPIEPTTDAAFTVTKSPVDGTTSVIRFSSTCGNTPQCVPTTLELQSQFNNYVLYGTNG